MSFDPEPNGHVLRTSEFDGGDDQSCIVFLARGWGEEGRAKVQSNQNIN